MWDLAWPELDAAAPAACAALLCTLLVYLSGCRVRRPRRPRPAPPAPPATWFVHDGLCFSRALLVGGPVVCVRPLAADEAPGVAEFGNLVVVAVADPRRLCAAAERALGVTWLVCPSGLAVLVESLHGVRAVVPAAQILVATGGIFYAPPTDTLAIQKSLGGDYLNVPTQTWGTCIRRRFCRRARRSCCWRT